MGEYYDFETRLIDDRLVNGFCYCCESTGWNEIFVEFDGDQYERARKINEEVDLAIKKKESFIKSIIND